MLGKLVEISLNDSANSNVERISLKMIIFCIGILNVKVAPLLIFWFSQCKKISYDANSTGRFKIIKRIETDLKLSKLLQIPYPLGFNVIIYHEGNISKMPDFDVFSLLEFRKRTARSHGIKKNGNRKAKVVFKNELTAHLDM